MLKFLKTRNGLAALVVLLLPLAVYASNIKVYREQGGARMVVGSGGSLDVASGGELDIESGGAFKIAGTAVSGSAGELNHVASSSQAAEGIIARKTARATYDVAVDGGTVGARGLGVWLPAKALITRSYFYVVTQFASTAGATATMAFSCEDANNIKTASSYNGPSAGSFVEGQSTGTAASMVGSIASACEITATIATASQTAGKANIFVDYVVGD